MFPDRLLGCNFESCILTSIITSLETGYKQIAWFVFILITLIFHLNYKITGQLRSYIGNQTLASIVMMKQHILT